MGWLESVNVFFKKGMYNYLYELDKEDMNEFYDYVKLVLFFWVGKDGYVNLISVVNNSREDIIECGKFMIVIVIVLNKI